MKNLLPILFIGLFYSSLTAQIINFPDNNFKAKLIESNSSNFIARNLNGDYFAIDSNNNNEIEVSEALEVSTLELGGYSISSLAGIGNFTNLVSLECQNNSLTNLNAGNLIYLTYLDCSNNLLINLNINNLPELQNVNCQFNLLSTLNANGILNLLNLDCSYNQLNDISLNNLENLETFNCSNNQLQNLPLDDLINVKHFDCSYNQISVVSTTSLTSLEYLNCSNNSLTSFILSGLVNFNELNCSSNQLNSLNLFSLPNFKDLDCNFNQLSVLNINFIDSLRTLSCTNNSLTLLNLNGLSQLQSINCANNSVSTIEMSGLSSLISLNCNNNLLSTLDFSDLSSIKYVNCNFNLINSLTTINLNNLLSFECSNNSLTTIQIVNSPVLQTLNCSNNSLTTLDVSGLTNLLSLSCSNNQLTSLYVKNGVNNDGSLFFSDNSNLAYICADESEITYIESQIINYNYINCFANSYCTFVPGGIYYTIQGNSKLDNNNNGCDANDLIYPNLKFNLTDGNTSEDLIQNTTGNYSKSVNQGYYTITPFLENQNYFTISPSTFSVVFPDDVSPFNQNFCVTSNGSHSDLEITLLPTTTAVSNNDVSYKIVYKNKATTTQSGTINLNFNDDILDFVSSNATVNTQSVNNLNWSFANLMPLETRSILVTLHFNSSSNSENVTPLTATIASSDTDENPNDNTSILNQSIETSSLNNIKTCLEGTSVSLLQVDDYVHYIIRFKNNGTTTVQNIVVQDFIDNQKFDVSTLIPVDGSHLFVTRIVDGKVEFIFENINLSNTSPNNECFVAFKIKILPTLTDGDNFSNTATVFFDYGNAPFFTNTETTNIVSLSTQQSEFSNKIILYPNPAKNLLNIKTENNVMINSVTIYNTIGQLIAIISNPISKTIDVSNLKVGNYILSITTEEGVYNKQFIKE